MKKIFFTLALLVSAIGKSYATSSDTLLGDSIRLHFSIIDPTDPTEPILKTPTRDIIISVEDHEISFAQFSESCTLMIVAPQTNTAVYCEAIANDEDKATIPSSLTGEYIICFLFRDYAFWGYIEL